MCLSETFNRLREIAIINRKHTQKKLFNKSASPLVHDTFTFRGCARILLLTFLNLFSLLQQLHRSRDSLITGAGSCL